MSDYDVIVIGGGTGNNVAAAAAEAGQQTALVEKGPLGGTCLNRGCNPSKMLIQRANVTNTIRDAGRFDVHAGIESIDFQAIVDDVESTLGGVVEEMEARYRTMDNLDLYATETQFVDERTLAVDDADITGDRIVIAAGSRPTVPPIDGLEETPYLTSREALYLDEQPDSLAILGGGYIAAELGYFFESLGTTVSIVDRNDTLLHREDADIARAFTEIAAERHDVYTGYTATGVAETDDGIEAYAESSDGETVTIPADAVLVALGRRPNTDTLALETTSVETNEYGFIETNEYLETTAENVWAQGDIAGKFLFKHAGDYETRYMINNAVHQTRRAVDYSAMPHAVFTEPQIAGVGQTEAELEAAGRDYVVGRAAFADSAMGRAKKLEDGFVKVLASPDGDLLGCHILGYEASTLIHEPVVELRSGDGRVANIADAIHVHPTLGKVIEAAFRDVPLS